jgi:hypothetical protein
MNGIVMKIQKIMARCEKRGKKWSVIRCVADMQFTYYTYDLTNRDYETLVRLKLNAVVMVWGE